MADTSEMARRLAVPCLVVLCAAMAVPSSALAKRQAIFHQVTALVTSRAWNQVGFVPMKGMDPIVSRIRYKGDVYIGGWQNALVGRSTLTESLKELRSHARLGYTVSHGVYADRKLTGAERRHFKVLVDLGRDADVLLVKQGHPACAAGLTLAQVRAIAAGRVRNWSEVVPGGTGAIAVRHSGIGDGYIEPRFGQGNKPRAGRGSRDPAADAAADASVAGISAWSRARFRSGVCKVPIDGVAPGNATVHDLTFKGAFPITFVALRRPPRPNNLSRTQLQIYVKFLKSDAAAKLFRGNGMLMAADKPAAETPGGGGGGGPVTTRDAQGRSVTLTRDDAGVAAAIAGERLTMPGSGYHFAFEAGSVLRVVTPGEQCSQTEDRWTLVEGHRYSEHGGGVIARVLLDFADGSSQETFLDLPNDPSGTGYMSGSEYARDRSLPGSCG